MTKTIQIKSFRGLDKIEVPENSNLLRVLQDFNLNISAPCGGKGKCKKCRILIYENSSFSGVGRELLACETQVTENLFVSIPQSNIAQIQTESYFPDIEMNFNQVDESAFGIAIDIGTTTVVVFLEDLKTHENLDNRSFLNPQQTFGADVISRIQYARGPEEVSKLRKGIVDQLNVSIAELCHNSKVSEKLIRKVSIAGNTTMLHLITGTNPSPLAQYPFKPVFVNERVLEAKEMDITALENACIHILPSVSAFVGADIVAGIAATELTDEDAYALFLDIGTNGEMALGNKKRILSCATAAGPAFEGAKISCGMGGVNGAIHKFSESDYKTIGDDHPQGLCGSGLVDVIAYLLNNNILDPSGYLEKDLVFLEEYDLKLTPQDIREVQLAKGAIIAGIYSLVKKANISINEIEKVYLAGGFGFSINPASAVRIGLLPSELEDKVIRAGNTAGLGARLFLQSDDFRRRIQKIAGMTDHFDLSMDMDFNELFVMNMNFPS